MADYNGTIGFNDLRFDNAVAYISPSFSGFTLAAAIIPGSMSTATGAVNLESDSIAEGYSIAGIYSNGPFYASAAYELVSTDHLMSTATALNPCFSNPVFGQNTTLTGIVEIGSTTTCSKADDDFTKLRFGLGLLDWNGFSLTGIYEKQEGLPGGQAYTSLSFTDARWGTFGYTLPTGAEERDLWQIQAGYRFGNFQLKGMYGQTESSANYSYPGFAGLGATGPNSAQYAQSASNVFDNTTTSWAIGLDYNFSKRTQVYVLYTANTSDAGDNPVFTNGLGGAPGTTSAAAPLPQVGLAGGAGALQLGAPAREWDGFSIGVSHRF
jgi:predicted porin